MLSVALLIGIFIIGFSLYPNNAVYADDVSPSRNVVSKNEPIFKVLAPKNQRKFKHRWTFKRSVKSIKKEGKQLKAYGQRTAIVGGLFVGAKAGVIGAVVTASGSAIYLVGDYQVSSVKKVKKGSKRVIKVDFRWINTKRFPLKGEFRIKQYYTYKGKRVSRVSTWYQKRNFGYGERW